MSSCLSFRDVYRMLDSTASWASVRIVYFSSWCLLVQFELFDLMWTCTPSTIQGRSRTLRVRVLLFCAGLCGRVGVWVRSFCRLVWRSMRGLLKDPLFLFWLANHRAWVRVYSCLSVCLCRCLFVFDWEVPFVPRFIGDSCYVIVCSI